MLERGTYMLVVGDKVSTPKYEQSANPDAWLHLIWASPRSVDTSP